MHRLANTELLAGGSVALASANIVETKSIIYYKLATFGQYHVDVATIITMISAIAVIDGFRRVWKARKRDRNRLI